MVFNSAATEFPVVDETTSDSVPALSLTELRFAYPGGLPVLERISFEVAEGQRLAIVGPSGAGKSTLLLHLVGLLPRKLPGRPAESYIQVCGEALTTATAARLRRRVGLVFQDPDDQLFCPTVAEDVAYGPINQGLSATEIEGRVAQALADVGLLDYADRSTIQLSTGERKRVCLAGVLACAPDVIVLDEPTSNLDPRARKQLIGRLSQFRGAQLIATHDLDFVLTYCHRVIVLDQGVIQADGLPHEVLNRTELMDRHGLEVPLRLQAGLFTPATTAAEANANNSDC